jgi:hypothetical protein
VSKATKRVTVFLRTFLKLGDGDMVSINMARVAMIIRGMDNDNIIKINVTLFQTINESEAVMLTAGESYASVTYV